MSIVQNSVVSKQRSNPVVISGCCVDVDVKTHDTENISCAQHQQRTRTTTTRPPISSHTPHKHHTRSLVPPSITHVVSGSGYKAKSCSPSYRRSCRSRGHYQTTLLQSKNSIDSTPSQQTHRKPYVNQQNTRTRILFLTCLLRSKRVSFCVLVCSRQVSRRPQEFCKQTAGI